MGLGVGIGLLAHRQDDDEGETAAELENINQLLSRHGASTFDEPTEFTDDRRGLDAYPYSFLHFLRRALALVRSDREVTPVEEVDADAEAMIDRETMMFESHLLCHSDCDGFYAPTDFAVPIVDDDGNVLGSAHRLRQELLDLAPALDIELADGLPTTSELDRLENVDDGMPLWREHIVWLSLWEATRVSIACSALVVFC